MERNLNFQQYKEELIEVHNKLKNHPFRENFMNGEFLKGTWKAQLSEYRKLLYDSTDIIEDMIYCCPDSRLERKDGNWLHDFRHLLISIKYYYLDGLREEYKTKNLESCNMTPLEIMSKTGITDISVLMLFLEKYIGCIHIFIESEKFIRICGVEYEQVTEPHNGYYYYHLVEFEKNNDKWKLVKEPNYIGTIPRITDNKEN